MKDYDLEHMRSQLLNNDNSCLTLIFDKEADFCIKNLVRRTGCSTEDAEDIFVESVMNFREKIVSNKLDYLNSVRNYIYTTCRNMWSVKVQKEMSKQKKLSDVNRFFYEEYEDDPITKYEELEDQEHLLKVSKGAFEKLSEQCKDILHFYYVDSLSMKLIAEHVGLADANVVKVTKHRCLKMLTKLAKSLLEGERHG